jgi:hypothetical protein
MKLRLSEVWPHVRQLRTRRSRKINMSREVRPYISSRALPEEPEEPATARRTSWTALLA